MYLGLPDLILNVGCKRKVFVILRLLCLLVMSWQQLRTETEDVTRRYAYVIGVELNFVFKYTSG